MTEKTYVTDKGKSIPMRLYLKRQRQLMSKQIEKEQRDRDEARYKDWLEHVRRGVVPEEK